VTATGMARRIVEHHFGSPPLRLERQTGGQTNDVFTVRHRQGEFVVRIGRDQKKLDEFLKEAWATARAREAGVPAPEVLEVGGDAVPRPYMIAGKLDGRAVRCDERTDVLRELGAYAARINSIRTHGFGGQFDWLPDRAPHDPTWDEFLQEEWELEKRLRVLKRHGRFPQQRIEKLRQVIEQAAGKRRRPFLNHGDLRLKNVLVNERGHIVAVLDWENCSSNLAPEWELSLALHDLSIDEKQAFLEGYGLRERKVSGMAVVMAALNLVNYAPKMEKLAKRKDRAALEHYRARLSGALDLYSL
jgi:aminoglycoside phosphotransferase (APT) family kinase protein